MCCSPWGHKESGLTELLNSTEENSERKCMRSAIFTHIKGKFNALIRLRRGPKEPFHCIRFCFLLREYVNILPA